MKTPSQDIYGTNRKRSEHESMPDVDHVEILSKPYADAVRRARRSTLVLVVVAVLITVLVSAVVVQQYLLIVRRPGSPEPLATRLNKPASTTALDLNAEIQAQSIIDELTEEQILKIPEGGNLPFNAQWAKQAAYHVIQAEKAARDERLDDALEEYAKVRLIFPQIAGVERQVGLIQLRKKEFAAAAATFETCAAEEEMTFGLANNLGVAYLSLENYPKAEQSFLDAARLNPKYPLAYFNLATLYIRTGKPEPAAVYFDKYLELKPEDMAAAQSYAMVLVQLKRWEKAATILAQIARIVPDVAPVHFRLAEALSHSPNRSDAVQVLRRATGLVDPRKALAWMSRPEFDLLRNESGFQRLLDELGAAD
jgi:tetratricopeptide (TPR) repeat protein